MTKYLLLLLLLLFAARQEVVAQEKLIRQNILIERYANYFSASHNLDYIMDRTKFYDDMEASISIHPESEDAEFYLWALQFPACVSVCMASEYDENSRRLTVTVSGDVTEDIPYA